MAAPTILKSGQKQKTRDITGATSGGRAFSGMATKQFLSGEQLVENMYVDTNIYKKMLGNKLWTTLAGVGDILYIFSYKKTTNAYQRIVIYKNGSTYTMRAIESDKTVVVPTGGAGDVLFTSPVFGFVQIGNKGFLINNSATTQGYSWDGTALTAITGLPASPLFCTNDGKRLVVGYASPPGAYTSCLLYSQETIVTTNTFTGGTGVESTGDYKTTIAPLFAINAGAGIVAFGTDSAEAHFIVVNDASSSVSGTTKIEGFKYTGRGVSAPNTVCRGKNFIYFVNSDGFFKMNPFTGETEDLVSNSGTLKRYFDIFVTTNSKLTFLTKNSVVVLSIADGDTNDKLLCYYEDTGVFALKTRVYSRGLGVVNGVLYSGENSGQIVEVFEPTTYKDKNEQSTKARIITEFFAPGSAHTEKKFIKGGFLGTLNPFSTVTVSYFKNGYSDVVKSKVYDAVDVEPSGTTTTTVGSYEVGLGMADTSSNTIVSENTVMSGTFITYAVEIIEESGDAFDVNSIYVDFLARTKDCFNKTISQTLFTISS